MHISFDDARRYMPDGLSEPRLRTLYEQLVRLDALTPFYSQGTFEHFLQGDLLQDVRIYRIAEDGVRERNARVLILSNTCDIAVENNRVEDVFATVAPIMSVDSWRAMLSARGVEAARIESILQDVRKQRVTQHVYLPAGDDFAEAIALLAQAQSLPIRLLGNWADNRIAILSQAGEWILVVKLAMHFSRQLEGVDRGH